jgi:hypothetical protein
MSQEKNLKISCTPAGTRRGPTPNGHHSDMYSAWKLQTLPLQTAIPTNSSKQVLFRITEHRFCLLCSEEIKKGKAIPVTGRGGP